MAIYTMTDLASITGVKPRTIRKWVEFGVVPGAFGVPGDTGPRWGEDHVRAIRLMVQIKEQQVTLGDLAERFGYRDQRREAR